MNTNLMAICGLIALGVAAKFGPAGNGDQILLAIVGALAGFVTGVAVARSPNPTPPATPPADPAAP